MTTLRSSSFLRLFVLPFVLSFWVSACSGTTGWRAIEASPLTADAVADADSLRILTTDSLRFVLYPDVTLLSDSLVGSSGLEAGVRTAIPLDSIQRVERVTAGEGVNPVLLVFAGAAVIGVGFLIADGLESLDWDN